MGRNGKKLSSAPNYTPLERRMYSLILFFSQQADKCIQQLQRLPTTSRPQELQTWLKTGKRSLERIPVIVDANSYGTEWVKWWKAAQPKERDAEQWPFPRSVNGDAGWHRFPAIGKDGIFVAVMALSWWASAIKSPNEITFFEEAVTDLHWVIQELMRVKKTCEPLPSLPPPPVEFDIRQPGSTLSQPNSPSHPPASSSHKNAQSS